MFLKHKSGYLAINGLQFVYSSTGIGEVQARA